MKHTILIAACALLCSACLKTGDETLVLPERQQLLPADVVDSMLREQLEQGGFPIHEGEEPPAVEGTYLASPLQLLYASDNYQPRAFFDLEFRFDGQTPRGLIEYSESQNGTLHSTPIEARITGQGNEFTVCCTQTLEAEGAGWQCTTAVLLSGRKSESGIADLHYALIIKDNHEANPDTDPSLAPVGTIRIFRDGDGLASKIDAQ